MPRDIKIGVKVYKVPDLTQKDMTVLTASKLRQIASGSVKTQAGVIKSTKDEMVLAKTELKSRKKK